MRRRKSTWHSVISPAEAERAIYIDFEGFKDQSPTLLGVLIGLELEQIVLDPELTPIAEARGHRVSTLINEAARLRDLSTEEQRLIVGYSQHERNVLLEYAQTDIHTRYRDARMIAKRWRSALYPKAPRNGRGLKDFLEFIEYPRGVHLGYRKSTKRIKAVLQMIRVRGSYDALTPVKKAQWSKLLEHNAIDCCGMRAVVIHAAKEMAAKSPRTSEFASRQKTGARQPATSSSSAR